MDETSQSLFFLGVRQLVPFQIGSSRYVTIYHTPNLKSPSLSQNFCNFLNAHPKDPVRYPHLGEAFDYNIYHQHLLTRNCLSIFENILFECSGSSIRMIEDPLTVDNWLRISPSISARSTITSINTSKNNSFGVATTINNSVIFSVTNDPVPRFVSTTFLGTDDSIFSRATEAKVNYFIEGETIIMQENGTITLYSQDKVLTKLEVPVETDFPLSSADFACHPRVVAASFSNEVKIFDLRHENPYQRMISCPVPSVSAIMPVDMHQIVVSSKSGIDFIDLRFPSEPTSKFEYSFVSPPMSLFGAKIENSGRVFDSIVAQCSEASEALFFPYTESEFAAPLRPFDVEMKPFETLEHECLSGIAIDGKNAFLQFEGGAVIGVEISPEEPPRRHFFTTIVRKEDGAPRDTFKFVPKFDPIEPPFSSKSDQLAIENLKWENAFPEVSSRPPKGLLFETPDVEKFEDPGTKGYLIEEKDALLLGDEDIPTALSMFWSNHMEITRNNL